MNALCELTVNEALAQLEAGAISSVELTRALLERIETVDGQIRAFLRTAPEVALAQAEQADAARARGEHGALLGIPLAVKDNLSTRGMETTCGSKILEGYTPPFDATAIARLKAAGAVILGQTNQDEFAMGSSTENSGYFPTANPWDLDRVPGGSSGGSAAAVAACEVPAALGTDTGGSVRQPAALCGLVGLRPTYGRISRYGLIAFASSLDQVGPLTRSVKDAALLTQIMAGVDPKDSTTRTEPVGDYVAALSPQIEGLRVGVPREYFEGGGVQPAVKQAVETAIETLEGLGAEVVNVSLPHTEHGIAVYYLIATAEASANLARFDGIRYGYRAEAEDLEGVYGRTRAEGFGEEVIRRIMLGTYALSAGYYDAYYLKAQKVRTLIRQDFDRAFKEVDVLVGPTSPFTAFRLGERVDDPLQMYLADIFTITQALAGVPALNVPCGFDEQGLPIGLQITGPDLAEAQILRVAYAYEQATDWQTRRPPLEEA
ncbi:MAG: Asp-tRNA(Asn)/Glu-tRNA(Gln) amidotransferase subunit GatA [Anaerolineae bacterium]